MKYITFLLIVFGLLSCSGGGDGHDAQTSSRGQGGDTAKRSSDVVRTFFVLRQSGDSDSAWYLLNEKTKKSVPADLFKRYCFVYRVKTFTIGEKKDGFIPVRYTYYDKKMDEKGALRNYFITPEVEYILVENGGITFPQAWFVSLREAIKRKDIHRAKMVVGKMLELSPRQPEVLKTARTMGLM